MAHPLEGLHGIAAFVPGFAVVTGIRIAGFRRRHRHVLQQVSEILHSGFNVQLLLPQQVDLRLGLGECFANPLGRALLLAGERIRRFWRGRLIRQAPGGWVSSS